MRQPRSRVHGLSLSSFRFPYISAAIFTFALMLIASTTSPAQSKVSTTTLALTTNAGSNTTVPQGSIVTLTATVTPASGSITAGQVNFCDAAASHCTDIHLLGTAQLMSNGKAMLKLRPGIGTHSFKAVFAGTHAVATSTSSSVAIAVTGKYLTTTTIDQTGIPNAYTLTASVAGIANLSSASSPSGSVSFVDTNNNNALLGTVPLDSSTNALSFLNVSNPATVMEPNVAAVADFNGDGIMDLAVSNSNSGQTILTILLGKGDGTFTAVATSPTVGLYPDGIAVGDFNGDAIPDLAVNSVDQSEVVVLLGNGDGTFTSGQVLNTGSSPQSITTADLNGDGTADLAVVNGNSVLIFLGNGDGSFSTTSPSLPTGMSPIGIAPGDFNGDGNADLAVVNNCGPAYPCSPNAGTVGIYLGKGDGTFTVVSATPATGPSSIGVAAGDFDGDGRLDLAVTNYGASGSNAITVLIGNGDGSFKTGVPYSAPSISFKSVSVADLNGDGIPDLAVGTFWRGMYTFAGHGDGAFDVGKPVVPSVFLPSGYIVTADFDGDGVPDIAMPDEDVNGTIAILLTQNTRTAAMTLDNFSLSGPGLHEVAASYSGDSRYLPSSSSTTELQVQVADPVLSVAPGTYTTPQTLTITDATPGATIYYAAYGANQVSGFIPYTGPIVLLAGQNTLQAYAKETGYLDSNWVQGNYTLYLPPATAPTISPAAGYYSGPQTVTISDSDPSAKIYYTTNGTPPSISANLYSGPITISSSETLVATALSLGHAYSPQVSAQYVIGSSNAAMIYSIAGTGIRGYSGDGGPATFAQTSGIYSVVKDVAGNIYFSDETNHMIRKIAAGTSTISVLAGNGIYGYGGDGGPAASAQLGFPANLALDGSGLFVADNANNTVRKIDLSSGIITTYAGTTTSSVFGDGGPANAAGLGFIGGLAVDASHNLYISSSGRIRQVTAGTGVISTIAGNGNYGYSGDGGPAISASFGSIYGLASDAAGSLYIADSSDELIRKITATNGVIGPSSIVTTVAGTPPSVPYRNPVGGYSGDGGPATSAKLNSPIAIAVDTSGNLFISDQYNNAIRKVMASNGTISTIAGNGSCGTFIGDGGAATSAAICFPRELTVDRNGNLLIADEINRLREVVPSATPPSNQASTPAFSVESGTYATPQTLTITDATPGASIYVSVDGSTPTTTSSGYSLPISIAGTATVKAIASAPGYENSAVASATITYSPSVPLIATVAGNGTQGFVTTIGPALTTLFRFPSGLAFDKTGNLYVSDSGNFVIWKITAAGTASIFAGTGVANYTGDNGPATSATLNSPGGLAFDNAGNLYIADSGNNVVRRVNISTGTISTVAGSNRYQTVSDGGPATSAWLSVPAMVAFDGANNLYIADAGNNRIRKVAANTGIITTVAGNGTFGDSGDGGLATSAGLNRPDSLAVDTQGNFYVGSTNGALVRKVTASTGIINSIAGVRDLAGLTSDGGPAVNSHVAPRSLALDSAGNLYISNDPGEIRKIDAATGVISRVAGIGYPGYSGDGAAAAVAQIYYPYQVAFDGAGNLYFADTMARVREVIFSSQTAATPAFSVPAGTYTAPQSVRLTDATAGAAIYYTTDGSTPTTASTPYTAPISVQLSETIKAIAVAFGYTPSAVASATYVLNLPAPTPSVTSISPGFVSAGSAQFTLTLNGAAFTSASVAYWGSSALATQFVSTTQLKATVPAGDVASPGTAAITVQTPAPGGGTSNTLQFEVDTAGSTAPPSFSPNSATVSAGGTASYTVTLPSSATNVSVQCLNLPTGAACTYSPSTGKLTITTTSSTPIGTYIITTVFTETLPGAAAVLLVPFMLASIARARRRSKRYLWIVMFAGATILAGVAVGCGGGGGSTSGGSNPPPATHQVTSSQTVTLIVN